MEKHGKSKGLTASASVPSFLHFRKAHSVSKELSMARRGSLTDATDHQHSPDEDHPEEKEKNKSDSKIKSIFSRRHTMVDKGISNQLPGATQQPLYLEEDTLLRHERRQNLNKRRHTLVGILGFGKVRAMMMTMIMMTMTKK